jgi:hypothetical protein
MILLLLSLILLLLPPPPLSTKIISLFSFSRPLERTVYNYLINRRIALADVDDDDPWFYERKGFLFLLLFFLFIHIYFYLQIRYIMNTDLDNPEGASLELTFSDDEEDGTSIPPCFHGEKKKVVESN